MVSTGPYHALAFKANGGLWVAGLHHGTGSGGMDEFNRLGTGNDSGDQRNWVRIGTWSDAHSVGAESDHSWLLTTSGHLWVWGYNDFGQLPSLPAQTMRLDSPTKVLERVALVGAGTRYTLVAPEEGVLALWGQGPEGTPPLQARDGLQSIHTGTGFVLAVSGGFHEFAGDPWAGLTTWGELLF